MPVKVTKKEVMYNFRTIIRVGYCELYYLFYYERPRFYTAGVYGWNSDIYTWNDIAIVIGYRPFGNIEPPYSTVDDYNNRARDIIESDIPYKEKRVKVEELIDEFIRVVIEVKEK